MAQLLIGTKNPAKLKEYKNLINQLKLDIKVIGLQDLNIKHDVEEPFKEVEKNAIKKAKEYFQISNVASLSDDGGLEIDFLNGEPGSRARRWAGQKMTDEEMIQMTLDKMRGVPMLQRTARLFHVSALALSLDEIHTTRQSLEGSILDVARGDYPKGFPFRALFYVSQFKKHILELSHQEYYEVNHRRKTIDDFKPYLEALAKKQS